MKLGLTSHAKEHEARQRNEAFIESQKELAERNAKQLNTNYFNNTERIPSKFNPGIIIGIILGIIALVTLGIIIF